MSSETGTVFLLGSALGVMLGLTACDRQSGDAAQANAAAPISGEVSGEVTVPAAPTPTAGAVDRTHKGEAAPGLAFQTPYGKPTTLAAFQGKPLLMNLWATWCAPCVKEMPTLDAVAGSAGNRLAVIAVSQDLEPAKVDAFFADAKFAHLQPYRDPKLALSLAYAANLPTTILFDAAGKEIWRVTGEMDWTSAKAKALIAEAG